MVPETKKIKNLKIIPGTKRIVQGLRCLFYMFPTPVLATLGVTPEDRVRCQMSLNTGRDVIQILHTYPNELISEF